MKYANPRTWSFPSSRHVNYDSGTHPNYTPKKQNSVRLPAWAAFQNAALWIQRSSSGQDEGHVLI